MNLKNEESSKTRYCVQYDEHSRMMCTVLCSLMEHQSLVDLAIRCGHNTIHAHKCVLAANSPYFREQLEKNPGVEQIVINGLDFAVVKSIVEFMYCGETNVIEDNFKYMVAASKMFKIRGIQALAADSHYGSDENIQIPAPLFLSKKPKYSSTYLPVNNINVSVPNGSEKINISNDPVFHRRLKRKYMRTEAEKACAKEAAASRLALEALQKELATTDQMSSFVIEESCTETTVENFIPHTEDTFMDNLNQLEGVPLQVVNYGDLNNTVLSNSGQILNIGKPVVTNAVLQYDNITNMPRTQESAAEKLKQILGGDIPSNVEIMFKTSDGNFVTLTDEVLQNITRESLQYQVIDEHGRAGEVQQLSINIKDRMGNDEFSQPSAECEDPIAKYVNPIENMTEEQPLLPTEKFEVTATELKMGDISEDQSILESIIESERRESEIKTAMLGGASPDTVTADKDPIELDIPSKNLQRSKLDSLKKRTTLGSRKLRAMNVAATAQFGDDFLNTSIELPDETKDLYSDDISCIELIEPCIESMDPLTQVGDNLLNKIHDLDGQISDNGSGDGTCSSKKLKITSGSKFSLINESDLEAGLVDYSPRKTRSNRQINELLTLDKNSGETVDKSDARLKKMGIRKRNK